MGLLSTLNRKLLRDLGAMKGQIAAIAVVIAAGVMTLILLVTSLDSVRLSQEKFYADYQFADLFASVTRAPESLISALGDIEGINLVETRVLAPVRLEVPGFDDPVRGQLLSIPDGRQPLLNRLHLVSGSLPESGRSDQIVISQPFAEAHGLQAGDELRLIIRGRYQQLGISGVALSPEFIYQIAPTDLLPDYQRYGIMWMNRRALGTAFDMDGAFNSLVASIQAGADRNAVIDRIDQVLTRYGSLGAHDRDLVLSHRMLSEQLSSLEVMAVILPSIFMGVSAFLLSVLMGRIVTTQRQQIAVLKAFGYSNGELAAHYAVLTGLIVAVGVTLGLAAGAVAGQYMAELYAEYFRFPETITRLQPRAIALAVLVAALAAGLGTFRSVYRAVSLPPAQAMRAPAPAVFRQGWFDRSVAGRWLAQTTRMVLRHLSRHPLKATLTVAGIALSGALLLVGHFQFGAVGNMVDVQYRDVMKMDMHVSFVEPTSARVITELMALPGVRWAEGYRNVAVELSNGHISERSAILGLPAEPQLRGLVDRDGHTIRLPSEGLFLTRYLAEQLNLERGDSLNIKALEGHQRQVDMALAGTIDEPLGVSAYMQTAALNHLMREGPALSGAWLSIDPDRRDELVEQLWEAPGVAGIGLISEAEDGLRVYMQDTVLTTMGILLLLAASITFALVYNNVRISFAERERELATLRVLGFRRGQIAGILVGEVAVLTLAAIPLGWLLGIGFAWLLSYAYAMDMMRIPFHISHQTLAFSTAAVIVAASLSVTLIGRRVARLDMVSALKNIE